VHVLRWHQNNIDEMPRRRVEVESGNFIVVFAKMHFGSYRFFFETRATNSSNLESKSFRMGDWFDFL